MVFGCSFDPPYQIRPSNNVTALGYPLVADQAASSSVQSAVAVTAFKVVNNSPDTLVLLLNPVTFITTSWTWMYFPTSPDRNPALSKVTVTVAFAGSFLSGVAWATGDPSKAHCPAAIGLTFGKASSMSAVTCVLGTAPTTVLITALELP